MTEPTTSPPGGNYQKLGVNPQDKLTAAALRSGMDRISTALILLFGVAFPIIALVAIFWQAF
ncbi:MAG: hypothetical protein WAM50_26185 [Pseudolabrys sp.]